MKKLFDALAGLLLGNKMDRLQDKRGLRWVDG